MTLKDKTGFSPSPLRGLSLHDFQSTTARRWNNKHFGTRDANTEQFQPDKHFTHQHKSSHDVHHSDIPRVAWCSSSPIAQSTANTERSPRSVGDGANRSINPGLRSKHPYYLPDRVVGPRATGSALSSCMTPRTPCLPSRSE